MPIALKLICAPIAAITRSQLRCSAAHSNAFHFERVHFTPFEAIFDGLFRNVWFQLYCNSSLEASRSRFSFSFEKQNEETYWGKFLIHLMHTDSLCPFLPKVHSSMSWRWLQVAFRNIECSVVFIFFCSILKAFHFSCE